MPPENVYLELEEHYHTRLLAYAPDVFDLTFQVVPPPFVMRQFVEAAEKAGCIMFDELRRASARLFADKPAVAARIELPDSEILTDEIGHVGYCASRCTSAEQAIIRRIYPYIGRLFARQTAEISLVIDPKALHARLDRPLDVEELTAGLDNETYLVAHP